jgi:hypothetical protein
MTEPDGIEAEQVAVLLREIEAIHAVNVVYWRDEKGRTSEAVAEYELRKERLELIRWELSKMRRLGSLHRGGVRRPEQEWTPQAGPFCDRRGTHLL